MSATQKKTAAFPLRLPESMRRHVEKIAAEDGVSMNQFITVAIAEKIGAINAAKFFGRKRQKADPRALKAFLTRQGGEPPRPGDELPKDLKRENRQ